MPRLRRSSLLALAALIVLAAAAAALLRDPRVSAWVKGHSVHVLDRRHAIDLRAAGEIFDLERIGDEYAYDPVALLVCRAGREQDWPWPEAPRGAFTLRTNELGLHEDGPTLAAEHGTRILVCGDSHTAGVVDNSDSFANRLEARLRALPGHATLEVLNAGVAYTGPYCYRGMLEKRLDLQPRVCVAVLFTGNDFWDDLKIRYALDGWTPPRCNEEYLARLVAASARWRGPVSQGFNQAYRFEHFPWERERALAAVIESFLAMRDRCAQLGIQFLAVVLPTKMDVEPEDDAGVQTAVRTELGLTPEAAAVNRELGRSFAESMARAGVRCLDPLEALRRAPHPLYWRQDYHLGRAGHELLSELLFEELRASL